MRALDRAADASIFPMLDCQCQAQCQRLQLAKPAPDDFLDAQYQPIQMGKTTHLQHPNTKNILLFLLIATG